MQDKLCSLRLSWNPQNASESWYPFHLVLQQEAGRYMMACLCGDRQNPQYYIADRQTCIDQKGKNYLVHEDACSIRNCLDLILDDMADVPAILNQFGAFAKEGRCY